MPRIKWSQHASLDLIRLYRFLASKSEGAAYRALQTIRQGVKPLGKHPEMGRAVEDLPPEMRELMPGFAQSAYVVRYRYDGKQIVILAVRRGREAGF